MCEMNRVCVLGGAGFVGSRLSQRFINRGIDHQIYDLRAENNVDNVIEVDVEDVDKLECIEGSDCIINLAAVHRDDVRPRSRYDDVNVQGAANVCSAATKHGIQMIIFTSSVAIYGFAPANTDESGVANYFNDYGRTKYLAENIYREWQADDPKNRTLVIVRPTVIFGEGNRGNVFNLLKQVACRRFFMFGDGQNKKSMAYVENVAAFLEHSLKFGPGVHIYNYVDKPDLDMNTLISIARKTLFGKYNVGLRFPGFLGMAIGYACDAISIVTGRSLSVSGLRVKKFMSTTQFNSSVSETGFAASVSLEEGLARTLKYEFLEDNSDKRTFDTE